MNALFSLRDGLAGLRRIARGRQLALIGAFALAAGVAGVASATVVTFQHGVAGYTGGTDVWLPKQFPTTNFGNSPGGTAVGRLGASDEQHTLIGFDSIFGNASGQIPLGSTINSATLGFFNSGITTPANGSVHQMLIPWIDLLVTWDSLNGGVNNAPLGEYDPTPSYSGPLGSGPFNVAPTVQAWSNGANAFGFALLPTATGEIVFQSNEGSIAARRPILTVDFTPIPEPGTLAALGLLGVAAMRRRGGANRLG